MFRMACEIGQNPTPYDKPGLLKIAFNLKEMELFYCEQRHAYLEEKPKKKGGASSKIIIGSFDK